MSKTRKPRRGAPDDSAFASAFVGGRLNGFSKDMGICLTGVPEIDDPATTTHAYFPAFMSCCSTLEYLAGLFLGRSGGNSLDHQSIRQYTARYMDASYDADTIRVLCMGFRNNVAHRGIASGVWFDRAQDRRLTWKIDAGTAAPALDVVAEAGTLTRDSPWDTPYSHRLHIRIGRLWRDIHDSGERYRQDVAASPDLLAKFMGCMRRLYPAP